MQSPKTDWLSWLVSPPTGLWTRCVDLNASSVTCLVRSLLATHSERTLLHLEELHAAGNEISRMDAVVAQTLKSLRVLCLSANRLRGLPAEIGSMRSLVSLRLENNELETLPWQLGQLRMLEQLWLGCNRLTALPESLGELCELRELWLVGNRLRGLPGACGALSRLERLELSHNCLMDLPDSLSALHRLRELWLRGNALREVPACLLPGPGALETLDLSANALTQVPLELVLRPRLHSLRLDDNLSLAYPSPDIVSQGSAAVLVVLRQAAASMASHAILATTAAPSDGAAAATAASETHVRRMLTFGHAIEPVPPSTPPPPPPRGRRSRTPATRSPTHQLTSPPSHNASSHVVSSLPGTDHYHAGGAAAADAANDDDDNQPAADETRPPPGSPGAWVDARRWKAWCDEDTDAAERFRAHTGLQISDGDAPPPLPVADDANAVAEPSSVPSLSIPSSPTLHLVSPLPGSEAIPTDGDVAAPVSPLVALQEPPSLNEARVYFAQRERAAAAAAAAAGIGPSTPKGPLVTSASSRLLTLPASLPDEAGAAAAGDGSADEDPAAPPSATSPASSSTSSSSAAISLGVATAGTGRESHDGASFFGAKVEAVRDVVQRAADVLTLPAIATQRGTSSEGAGPRGRASAQHKGHHHQVGTPSISSSTASPASLRRMLSTEARF